MMRNLSLVLFTQLAWALSASAGARIDLRPATPPPEGGYPPYTVVEVDVFLVDTGNPEGDITFEHINLDVTDTLAGELVLSTFEDSYCCGCDNYFEWASGPCIDQCVGCPQMMWSSWIHLDGGFEFVLPNDGEVRLGRLQVDVGASGGLLDVMNADDPFQFAGAYMHVANHHPGHPPTLWRAYTGELTGGQLDLMVNSGEPLQIIAGNPPLNAIDARQPTAINGVPDYGWSEVEVTFNGVICAPDFSDFVLFEEGGDGLAGWVDSVEYLSEYSARLYLFPTLEPGTWTTIYHLPSGASMRLGYLPGDANGDGTSSPTDILALIDSLNGVAPRPIHSTDINRSGLAEPSDILRLIDLLNGAGEFDAWNGAALP